MDWIQRRRWKRLHRRWERVRRNGGAATPVELFFDAPLRDAIQEYWDGGHRDVSALAIQARVAYLTARWTFWLTVATGLVFASTAAALAYAVWGRPCG